MRIGVRERSWVRSTRQLVKYSSSVSTNVESDVREEKASEDGAGGSHQNAKKSDTHHQNASIHPLEPDVGITEYIGSHPGFFAILKRRYNDFMVHELAQDGDVVKLSDFSTPTEDTKITPGKTPCSWPRERGKYCRFVLYKENKGTMEAISLLSHLLKIESSCFRYAGTKDKRAVTSQLVTAFKVTAERLNQNLGNMRLGNFQYVSNPLRLGDLTGNRFTIILRNVSCESHVVAKAVESLSEAGFVNYFGMQRFGISSIPTHHIGRCMSRSNWKGAIDLILNPRPGERSEVESAREYFASSGDIAGTLSRIPKSHYTERLLLRALQKHAPSRNYLAAFNLIPRNVRLMYLHSWHSFCWNHVVSWRLKNFGPIPIVGDLMLKQDPLTGHESMKYVTERNIGECDIHDVVLPLLGADMQLPHNQTKREYERFLEAEGMSIQQQLKMNVGDLALISQKASYRRIVIKPRDISWEELYYDDYTVPLVLTDIDQMLGKKMPQSLPGGKFKAVRLEFSLPSAAYATMAMRELLKMNTSSTYHATLSEDQ